MFLCNIGQQHPCVSRVLRISSNNIHSVVMCSVAYVLYGVDCSVAYALYNDGCVLYGVDCSVAYTLYNVGCVVYMVLTV